MQIIICAPTIFALEVPVYLLKDGETEAKTIGYFQTAELDQALFTLAITLCFIHVVNISVFFNISLSKFL